MNKSQDRMSSRPKTGVDASRAETNRRLLLALVILAGGAIAEGCTENVTEEVAKCKSSVTLTLQGKGPIDVTCDKSLGASFEGATPDSAARGEYPLCKGPADSCTVTMGGPGTIDVKPPEGGKEPDEVLTFDNPDNDHERFVTEDPLCLGDASAADCANNKAWASAKVTAGEK